VILEYAKQNICINSDFTDYYDSLSDAKSVVVYNRFRDKEDRGKLLNLLKTKGVKTIELKSVKEYAGQKGMLVVYTRPELHNSQGKMVIDINEAYSLYPNNLASKFSEEADGTTLKFLQIGQTRFKIIYKTTEPYSLKVGDIQSIERLNDNESSINIPIFSIDYINVGGSMVAIDFNRVQNLSLLGIQEYINSIDIIKYINKHVTTRGK